MASSSKRICERERGSKGNECLTLLLTSYVIERLGGLWQQTSLECRPHCNDSPIKARLSETEEVDKTCKQKNKHTRLQEIVNKAFKRAT